MKTMKWIGWCGMVLLVGSLMWTTGCGGSSGSGGGTTTIVVTNAVGETTTVVVTNEPAAQALVAPQLASPVNNATPSSKTMPGKVDFIWTAVPGATSYVLELDGTEHAVNGTSTSENVALGTHNWRVWAMANGVKGPESMKFSFRMLIQLDPNDFQPLNP